MATVIGYANDKSFSIFNNAAKKTVLTLTDVKKGNLFTIKDENGLILYKEAIQQGGVYKKGFDLTALPDGSYFFELEKDIEVTTIPFTVKETEVAFEKSKSETVFKPLTVIKGDFVFVSQLSLDEEPLEIEIYYDGGTNSRSFELLYSETIKNTKNIERVFKFTNLKVGDYKIVYRTEGKQFIEFI